MPTVWICTARPMTNPSPGRRAARPRRPLARWVGVRAQVKERAISTPAGDTNEKGTSSKLRVLKGIQSGPRHTGHGRWIMQKWEYATVPLITHALQEILNQWGEDGWELVQVLESPTSGTTGFLKRPKEG
jgi:uncharacterized protein DUF4177